MKISIIKMTIKNFKILKIIMNINQLIINIIKIFSHNIIKHHIVRKNNKNPNIKLNIETNNKTHIKTIIKI
jgi:hypothetical protein